MSRCMSPESWGLFVAIASEVGADARYRGRSKRARMAEVMIRYISRAAALDRAIAANHPATPPSASIPSDETASVSSIPTSGLSDPVHTVPPPI